MEQKRLGHFADRRLKLQKEDKVLIKPAARKEFNLSSKYGVVKGFSFSGSNNSWLIDIELEDGVLFTFAPSDIKYIPSV